MKELTAQNLAARFVDRVVIAVADQATKVNLKLYWLLGLYRHADFHRRGHAEHAGQSDLRRGARHRRAGYASHGIHPRVTAREFRGPGLCWPQKGRIPDRSTCLALRDGGTVQVGLRGTRAAGSVHSGVP
ncbi:hypothetical protein [Paraburkholderia sp. A1RO-1]|uniref:hypothetical protein n=1 Tax=unclassified Paraburkholderia TaxID=2615204 RepID=UPI003B763CEE